MSDFMDKLNSWQKDKQQTSKPIEEDPLQIRPLTQRLDTMADMFTYGFWGWEYENETRDLLLEAARNIQMYEEMVLMEQEKTDE